MQNPHDPDAHYADKRTKQWIGYKVHVTETVDPEATDQGKRASPPNISLPRCLTTEAAQDEMAGLTETLKREQEHHEIKPQAIYTDAGYVTESTLTQAEQNGMELLGPTRPDPHKGPYNSDAFHVDVENKRQAVCPQGKPARNAAASKIAIWEPSTTASSGVINATAVRYKSNVRVPRVAGRTLVVGLRHDLVEQRRREMKQTGFSKSMHPRNGIEGTHSELVRGHAMRRTKYRGLKPGRFIELLHRCGLQCKTISKSIRFPDETPALSPA